MRRLIILILCVLAAAAALPAGAQPSSPSASASSIRTPFDRRIEAAKGAMMASPEAALDEATAALSLSRRLPAGRDAMIATATAQWLQGEALIGLNELARAEPIINSAIHIIEQNQPNRKLHGDLLRARGAIHAMTGRVQSALRDFLRAHATFQAAGERRSQALALQDIGQIYADAGDLERSIRYDNQSVEAYPEDPNLNLTRHNNAGQAMLQLGRYREAQAQFRSALEVARQFNSPLLTVRILTNLAAAQNKAGDSDAAWRTIRQARALAVGEAAGWSPFVSGVAAAVALKRNDLQSARAEIDRAFQGMDLARTPLPFRHVHEVAARIYEQLGEPARALEHLKAFQRLDTEARNLIASNSAQLMAARFDFANQNLRIAQLREEQLQADIQLERERSQFRSLVLGGLLAAGAILSLVLLASFLSIRRSRDRVRAANENLTQVNIALEKALAAKTEFLATTSHEIRTPLNGILGMTQVLLADGQIEPSLRERMEVIHGAGETMRALVDDILDVAKMETGELTVAPILTDLPAILDDSAHLWRPSAEGKGLALKTSFNVPARVMIDGGRLRQIIFNLMSNAIKFTETGSVELAMSSVEHEGGVALLLRVRDTGIGIAQEHQGTIFEAFQQVNSSTTRTYSGTGLGLAICHRLAEALGGRIEVESALGQGSTFTVTLPFEPCDSSALGPHEQAKGERTRTLADSCVLLVEANPLNRSILQLVLASGTASVQVAADGTEALKAIGGGGIDHIIVDAQSAIAGEDQLSSLRTLVAAASAQGARTSLLATPSGSELDAELAQLGAAQVIFKPISPADLLQALRALDCASGEPRSPAAAPFKSAA